MTKIIFATNNRHKLQEAEQILGRGIELETPAQHGITEDIPEEQPTLEGNALQKARYVYAKTGKNCFADDTGLEVDALGGEPGVRSARYAGEEHDFRANIELLLKNMEGEQSRTARFRTVVALIYQGVEYLFEGEVRGEIVRSERGEGGFGYDGVFLPEGYRVTFAQMAADEKNKISHRARAMAKLAKELERLLKRE